MRIMNFSISVCAVLLLGVSSSSTFAAGNAEPIGRVILLNGEVKQITGREVQILREGSPILERAVIKTGPQSSVKLMLQDQSTLSLGPDSSMRMDEVKNQPAANVSILGGQVRSKVIKDLL